VSVLDPAVRDLLAAINTALDGGWANRPAIRAAIQSTLRFEEPADSARWLVEDEQATAAADTSRVRAGDLRELYQADRAAQRGTS
jgi:hypothetical protein